MSAWGVGFLLHRLIRRSTVSQVERAFWTIVVMVVAVVLWGMLFDALAPRVPLLRTSPLFLLFSVVAIVVGVISLSAWHAHRPRVIQRRR
jgi:hypothetical protein